MANVIKIGIDLGTTNTVVCVLNQGKLTCLKFWGRETLPSVIYVESNGEIVVGANAVSRGEHEPNNCIKYSKTHMGNLKKNWMIEGLVFTPTDVAAVILKTVRDAVFARLQLTQEDVIEAVITVPFYFTPPQINETKKAGEQAQLIVTHIIAEPIAVAVSALAQLNIEKKLKRLFILDMRENKYDINVLQVNKAANSYKILGTVEDLELGWESFEQILFAYILSIFKDGTGINLDTLEKSGLEHSEYQQLRQILLYKVQEAKAELVEEDEAHIFVVIDLFSGKSYQLEAIITRELFNQLCQPLYDKIKYKFTELITNINYIASEKGRVILIGEMCYVVGIYDYLNIYFEEPVLFSHADDDVDVVARGACIVANNSTLLQTLKK
ncbi:MAG: hypothetical protein ATN33_05870 [Epulopiscium sp. Nele67-Bin001]|nr:MAG: hypothetical protein ATN33_05870 [Epulopiscium sp. Nele67-Bin001]